MTSAFAPPCSGPLSVPIAATIAEYRSVSVAAATRAANVEAFSSWSACSTSAMSNACVDSAFGRVARQHVEEVGRMSERRVRLDGPAARLQAAVGGDDAAHLRGEANRLAVVRRRRIVAGLGIVLAERRGQRPQHVHAVGGRQLLHQPQDRLGHRPRGGQLRLQVAELGAVRQAAVPEQIADLLERRAARQIVDVVAEVRQHAAVAIQVTDGRGGGDDVFEPALVSLRGHEQSYQADGDAS